MGPATDRTARDTVFILASVAGIVSGRRTIQVAAAATAFTFLLIYMFQELGVLGSW